MVCLSLVPLLYAYQSQSNLFSPQVFPLLDSRRRPNNRLPNPNALPDIPTRPFARDSDLRRLHTLRVMARRSHSDKYRVMGPDGQCQYEL
jgi:hypothetical protein